MLDLEQPVPAALTGTADIVIAVNVLHATADIGVTLEHCRALLGAGGTLLLNEAVRRRDFATLVFGLTEGWWRFHDAERRLPHSPLLDEPGWRAILAEAGFAAVVSRTAEQVGAEAAQVVLLAQRSASVATQPAPAVPTALPTPMFPPWLPPCPPPRPSRPRRRSPWHGPRCGGRWRKPCVSRSTAWTTGRTSPRWASIPFSAWI